MKTSDATRELNRRIRIARSVHKHGKENEDQAKVRKLVQDARSARDMQYDYSGIDVHSLLRLFDSAYPAPRAGKAK